MKLKNTLSESGYNRYIEDTLKLRMANVSASMEVDTQPFETLLCSYPNRLRTVNNATGRQTDYWLKTEKINYCVAHLIRTSFDI